MIFPSLFSLLPISDGLVLSTTEMERARLERNANFSIGKPLEGRYTVTDTRIRFDFRGLFVMKNPGFDGALALDLDRPALFKSVLLTHFFEYGSRDLNGIGNSMRFHAACQIHGVAP